MNLHAQRRYEMLIRILDFRSAHRDRIPASTLADSAFDVVQTVVAAIGELAAKEISYRGWLRELTTARTMARSTVVKELRVLVRTARVVDEPHFRTLWKMPPRCSDLEFSNQANAMVNQAVPLEDKLAACGMKSNCVDHLRECISAFTFAIDRKVTAGSASSAVTPQNYETKIARGFTAARQLDGVLLNLLADDESTLAAWKTARRVDWWHRTRKKNPAMANG